MTYGKSRTGEMLKLILRGSSMCEAGNKTSIPSRAVDCVARDIKMMLSRRLGTWLFVSIAIILLFVLNPQTSLDQATGPEILTLDQAVQFALQHSTDLENA